MLPRPRRLTNANSIVVRVIEEPDVAELGTVLAPDVSVRQVENRWAEHQQGHRQTLVALLDDVPVGTVSSGETRHKELDSLRMFALDVEESYRRRGIGMALIVTVEEEALRLGLRHVSLEVDIENERAIRLYEGLGDMRLGEPVLNRWMQLTDDGEGREVESLSWNMAKEIR